MDRREQIVIWKRALSKIGKIRQGSFEGSKTLSDSYWKERLDPLHRPNTELQALWAEFVKDATHNGRDFYEWLRIKGKAAKQQVSYLTDDQRIAYKFTFTGSNILFSQEAQDAGMNNYDGEVIYVLDGTDSFYFGVKSVGTFHHSSMLAGAPVAGAGTMIVRHRAISEVNNHSGHYKPGMEEMRKVAKAMAVRGAAVDAIDMKVYGANAALEWEGKVSAIPD